MAYARHPEADTVAYHGEVWTDTRGYATVELPVDVNEPLPPLEYELRDVEPPTTARVAAELRNRRFTIATERPHVKVAWWIRGRRGGDPSDTDNGRRR